VPVDFEKSGPMKGTEVKRTILRSNFPGQIQFPEVSTPIGPLTFFCLIAVASICVVLVLWLKS
jgi:hypothetical protein